MEPAIVSGVDHEGSLFPLVMSSPPPHLRVTKGILFEQAHGTVKLRRHTIGRTREYCFFFSRSCWVAARAEVRAVKAAARAPAARAVEREAAGSLAFSHARAHRRVLSTSRVESGSVLLAPRLVCGTVLTRCVSRYQQTQWRRRRRGTSDWCGSDWCGSRMGAPGGADEPMADKGACRAHTGATIPSVSSRGPDCQCSHIMGRPWRWPRAN